MAEIREYTKQENEQEERFMKSVDNFRIKMYNKLVKNAHKGGWENCDMEYLVRRLREEADEIEEAIKNNKRSAEVESECADVANFAMMIAENYRVIRINKIIEKMPEPYTADQR